MIRSYSLVSGFSAFIALPLYGWLWQAGAMDDELLRELLKFLRDEVRRLDDRVTLYIEKLAEMRTSAHRIDRIEAMLDTLLLRQAGIRSRAPDRAAALGDPPEEASLHPPESPEDAPR